MAEQEIIREIEITNKSDKVCLVKVDCQKYNIIQQDSAQAIGNSQASSNSSSKSSEYSGSVSASGGVYSGSASYSQKNQNADSSSASTSNNKSKSGSVQKSFSEFMQAGFVQIKPNKTKPFAVPNNKLCYITVANTNINNWAVDVTKRSKFVFDGDDLDPVETKQKGVEEKEEKKEHIEVGNIVYNQSFFIIDMEGLTNQFTKFTEKVFYSIYAFSDIIVWNDKTIGSDHFKQLMTKLKKTMSNISESCNKPSFLYLRRDKDNFFEFGKHKTFDKYINYSEGFKTFRELNLFSEIRGYELVSRPSKNIPFPENELKKLMHVIFKLHKTNSKFISNYYELEKQLNYINQHGVLSLGTQIVMEDDVLKWFLFDADEKGNERKILMFACQYGFSSEKICNAFDEAINAPKFKNFEKVGIIDEEFKKQLLQNRQVMLHCIANKHDKLKRIEEVAVDGIGVISAGIIAGIPAIAGGLVGGIIGGVADIVVTPFKKGHKMGTYTTNCAGVGALAAAMIPGGIVMAVCNGASIAIEKGVEVSSKIKDKNYSRYQLPSSVGFSTKVKLIEADNLISLFDNSQNMNQHCQDLHFDQQLLALASSTNSIVLIIETKRSTKSLISYGGSEIYFIRMSWIDATYSAKMFYSLYCIANLVIWKGDTTDIVESKRFKSFTKQLQLNIHTKTCKNVPITCPKQHLLNEFQSSADESHICNVCRKAIFGHLYGCRECNFDLCWNCHSNSYSANRKPAFLYFCYVAQQTGEPELLDITQNKFFDSFCGLNMFSSIFAYKIGMNNNQRSLYDIIVNTTQVNTQRFVKLPFEYFKSTIDYYKCPACSKIIDISDSKVCTQCIHCGHLNFDQQHNNEYSFYRHLIYINKYNILSFELQLILDHPILKYFLFDKDDEYADILMWNFAKKHSFNSEEICKQFDNSHRKQYKVFSEQLNKGKALYLYALSSKTQQWITPSLSSLVINENQFAVAKNNEKKISIEQNHDEKIKLISQLNEKIHLQDDMKNEIEEKSTSKEQTLTQVDKLVNMGFEKDVVISALQISDDNFATALELLIANSNNPTQLPQNSISKLMNMGFEKNVVIEALQKAENNFDAAMKILVEKNVDEKKVDEHEFKEHDSLLFEQSAEKQFYNFLKRVKMEKYFDIFKENDCCDMECIMFFDDEGLENDIGIKSKMARKRFLKKCEETKKEMDKFKNEYGIPTLLYKRLAEYGIVTMYMLCNEVKEISDLKNKFKITNENQCNLLWNLVQQTENVQIEKEGDEANIVHTPDIK
eukprot:344336_1